MAIKIRCSQLPRLMICPQSGRGESPTVEIADKSAALGTAVHKVLSEAVRCNGMPPDEYLAAVKQEFDIPAGSDFDWLVIQGVRALKEIRAEFETEILSVTTDVSLDDGLLSGHTDLLFDCGRTIVVVDWKSGRKTTGYFHQMAGYAALALSAFSEADNCITILVWLRDGEYTRTSFTREETQEWYSGLREQLGKENYVAGEHCIFCPRTTECQASGALIQAGVRDLLDGQPLPAAIIPNRASWLTLAPRVLAAYNRLGLIEKAITAFRDAVRMNIAKFGSLPADDGTELALVPYETETIDPRKGWGILAGALTEDELASALKVSKTIVLDYVRARAARGEKKKAAEELMTALRKAGAITIEQREALKFVRKEEKNDRR